MVELEECELVEMEQFREAIEAKKWGNRPASWIKNTLEGSRNK